MKEHECPNCGAANPKVISEGEFKCQFCHTLFVDEAMLQRKKAAEKKTNYHKAQTARYDAEKERARSISSMSKRILLFVSIALLIIFGFVGYMAKKSMDQSAKAQEEMIKSLQPLNIQTDTSATAN